MTKNFLFTTLLMTILFLTTSCNKNKKDASSCGTLALANSELTDQLAAATNAAVALGSNPTKANCEAYRTAWLDYIDVAEKYLNCNLFADGDLEKEIADARQEAMDADCEDL